MLCTPFYPPSLSRSARQDSWMLYPLFSVIQIFCHIADSWKRFMATYKLHCKRCQHNRVCEYKVYYRKRIENDTCCRFRYWNLKITRKDLLDRFQKSQGGWRIFGRKRLRLNLRERCLEQGERTRVEGACAIGSFATCSGFQIPRHKRESETGDKKTVLTTPGFGGKYCAGSPAQGVCLYSLPQRNLNC